jgi:hypothetical protein
MYYDTADTADWWIELRQDLAGQSMTRFAAALTGWLRDDMLGPAPGPPSALVILRAIQAALFTRGVLLRWDAAALGPGPARRLPGDLTLDRVAMLAACCDTSTAAAAVLCLHLNHGTSHLGQLTIGDMTPDGSALLLDRPRRPRVLTERQAGARRDRIALGELIYGELVRVPPSARPIIAAHLAYRLGQGAADHDPFFINPRSPDGSPERILRNSVTQVCQSIGYVPPWLHGYDCRYGADIGLAAREPGWLAERGLSLHLIDPAVSERVPPHVSPQRYRPASQRDPAALTTVRPSSRPAPIYQQRMTACGLSPWELGNLLGIHPHLLTGPDLAEQPARLLLELARALQVHPADLYPPLDTVLDYGRADRDPADPVGPSCPADARDSDAVTVLTALAFARTPLGPSDLTRALGWPLPQVRAALRYAEENPNVGGALTLRRVPPEAYTAVPRPEALTSSQRHALTSIARARDVLTLAEATVVLAALAFGQTSDYAKFRTDRQHDEHILKQAGLVHSVAGPHHARLSRDVMFSLRYCNDDHITN